MPIMSKTLTVLLLGSTGMAGSALKNCLINRNINVVGVARSNAEICCDITNDVLLADVLNHQQYDAVINAAAQVDIDICEDKPLESWCINARLVALLATFSLEQNVPLLQISTDHYYNYGDNSPHKETDQVVLLNDYSRHKFAAEAYALSTKNSLVLRTSILGQKKLGQQSLLDWALKGLLRSEKIDLFHDAWTSSIDVETFANIALDLFLDIQYRGLLNVGTSEVYSKEKLIRTLADLLKLDHSKCRTQSIKSRFKNRSNCLGLDVSLAEKVMKKKMPTIKKVCEALSKTLKL